MAQKQSDDEFELILGNKQLLSLFFVIVVFFAAFFSVGYTVGFGHGTDSRTTAVLEPEDLPGPPPVRRADPPKALIDDPEPTAKQETAEKKTPPPPPKAQEKPKPTPTKKVAAAPPPKPKPTPKPAAKPAVATSAASGYHLQVAALRTKQDADLLAGKLKAKGYPAAVNSSRDDGWIRVVVGPFSAPEDAKQYKARLSKEGFDSMLRKL